MIEKFFLEDSWKSWFVDLALKKQVSEYMIEDYKKYASVTNKLELKDFLDSDFPRMRNWFQGNLWNQLKNILLTNFEKYELSLWSF